MENKLKIKENNDNKNEKKWNEIKSTFCNSDRQSAMQIDQP